MKLQSDANGDFSNIPTIVPQTIYPINYSIEKIPVYLTNFENSIFSNNGYGIIIFPFLARIFTRRIIHHSTWKTTPLRTRSRYVQTRRARRCFSLWDLQHLEFVEAKEKEEEEEERKRRRRMACL